MESNIEGTHSTSNGLPSERPLFSDGEYGDEAQGREQHGIDGHHGGGVRDGEEKFGDISHKDVVAQSSRDVKEERRDDHGSSTDQDPLVEPRDALQSLQVKLEQELLKFKEIRQDISIADSTSDLPSDESICSSCRAVQSEVVKTDTRDVDKELEDLFKGKMEAEVAYWTMSRTVEELKVVAVDQIPVSVEQTARTLEHAEILSKHEDAGNGAVTHKAEAVGDILENIDETLKLQKRVCKYSSCFLVQLALLVGAVGVFILQSSSNDMDVVPT